MKKLDAYYPCAMYSDPLADRWRLWAQCVPGCKAKAITHHGGSTEWMHPDDLAVIDLKDVRGVVLGIRLGDGQALPVKALVGGNLYPREAVALMQDAANPEAPNPEADGPAEAGPESSDMLGATQEGGR